MSGSRVKSYNISAMLMAKQRTAIPDLLCIVEEEENQYKFITLLKIRVTTLLKIWLFFVLSAMTTHKLEGAWGAS